MHKNMGVGWKLNFSDKILIIYFILQILLFNWLFNRNFYKYMLLLYTFNLFIFIIKLRKKFPLKFNITDLIILLFSFGIIGINISQNGVHNNFFRGIFDYAFGNIFIIIYFAYIINNKTKSLEKFIVKYLSIVLNLYFFINVPIIIKQIDGNGFMMRFTQYNPFYTDHITGMIGESGTHRLTFYWIVLTLLNIYIYQKYKNKTMFWIIISQVVFMIIISSYNDNTAFYYVFPIIISQFFIKELFQVKIKTIGKGIILVIITIMISTYLINHNEQLNKFYNSRIVEKYQQYLSKDEYKDDEERIALFKYALKYGNGYKFGSGIGSISYYGDEQLPKHFGMSEISSKVYEGGIIYLATIIIVYAYCTKAIFNISDKSRMRNFILFILISMNYLFLAMYTQLFGKSEIIGMIGIIACIFRFKYENVR